MQTIRRRGLTTNSPGNDSRLLSRNAYMCGAAPRNHSREGKSLVCNGEDAMSPDSGFRTTYRAPDGRGDRRGFVFLPARLPSARSWRVLTSSENPRHVNLQKAESVSHKKTGGPRDRAGMMGR